MHHPTSRPVDDVSQLLQRAHALHGQGDLRRAEKLYKEILAHDPANADVLHLLGFLYHQSGRPAQALCYLAAGLKSNPRSPPLLSNHGLVLHTLGRGDEALASYQAALAITPDDPDLLNKCGAVLLDLDRPQEAFTQFNRALALDPRHAEALGNRGNALLKLERPEEAIETYDAMRAVAGDSAQLLTNRAHALRRLDRLEAARADLEKAVTLDARFAEAWFERGLVELTLGNFDTGWAAYERRWETARFAAHRRDFSSPLWTGKQSLAGRTILLHAEQGFGDTIQFARYVALLPPLAATVLLEVQPELVSLTRASFREACVFARGEKLAAFDLHCPLMSLPLACKDIAPAIPCDVPYLEAPASDAARWAARLWPARLRIGVAWAGRRSHDNDAQRSMPLERFAALFALSGIQFVSLQRDLDARDKVRLREFDNVLDVGDSLADFADAAALVSQLDALVCVDTALAHLAGALAKPTSILLPAAADFRWLRGRDDSPWYPTARLFRQPRRGDWGSVIMNVRAHLVTLYC
ncbi:MAG TPA: tetratricopeptide repeat protein [Pseudolabrys sp.]|nr:tetratricopeptide repeat protein [Pseudolabrys sp.]